MKLLHVTPNLTEAELLRGVLESRGIEAFLRGQHVNALAGEVPFEEAAVTVWILDDDQLETAKEIVGNLSFFPGGASE